MYAHIYVRELGYNFSCIDENTLNGIIKKSIVDNVGKFNQLLKTVDDIEYLLGDPLSSMDPIEYVNKLIKKGVETVIELEKTLNIIHYGLLKLDELEILSNGGIDD